VLLQVDFALLSKLWGIQLVPAVRFLALFSSSSFFLFFLSREYNTYLAPKPQLLLLLALCILLLRVFYARELALVEACEVFFARRWVEVDFFRGCIARLALRHVERGVVL
jgi:hypothetical protein